MAFRLIPREGKFFDDFKAMADYLREGAKLLQEMFAGENAIHEKANAIKEIEHKCDFLTHDVIQRLNRTFVTPLDREDIHELARSLDDVMDAMDGSAALVPLYRISRVRTGVRELTQVIVTQVGHIRDAIGALESKKGVMELAAEIDRLEGEADRIHGHALSRLFEDEKDPITLIKWKEILDLLEETTDHCQDVANLIESVIVKHS